MTNETPQKVLRQHLDSGERLLWSGRPRQGFVFSSIDFLLVPFSLLWGGFSFFWTYTVFTEMPFDSLGSEVLPFIIIGPLFSVLGLYIIAGRFFIDRYYRAHLYYGITDQRAMTVSAALSKSVTSFEIDTLRDVHLVERSEGRGTLRLMQKAALPAYGSYGLHSWHATVGQPDMFFEIEKPKDALKILRKQREHGRSPT